MVSKSSSKLECRETIIRNFKSEWTEDLNLKISWTNEINSKDIFFDKYQLIAASPTATYQKVLHPAFSQWLILDLTPKKSEKFETVSTI